MRISFPKITTDSFITPLKIYHKEMKKTFTPFLQKTIRGKLLDLIKRILCVLASPVLYPLTIASAAVGYGLKGLCKLLPKKTLHEMIALQHVSRGDYDNALKCVSQSSESVKNNIREAICNKYLARGNRSSVHDLKAAFDLTQKIVNDSPMQDRLYREIALLDPKILRALTTTVEIKSDATKFMTQAEIYIKDNKFGTALGLLRLLKNMPDSQKYGEFIDNCIDSIYPEYVKDDTPDDVIPDAKNAIELMQEGPNKHNRYSSFLGILVRRKLLAQAEEVSDSLPPTYIHEKDDGYQIIATKYSDNGDKTKAQEVIQKLSPGNPHREQIINFYV
jgi:hypothetical protein